MKFLNYKNTLISTVIATMLAGCATGNQTIDNNQSTIIGTTVGAIAGVVLGNNIGGGSKSRNKVIGAVAGAAIGGAIGYSLDQQAKEVAKTLDTTVNNDPQAVLNPSNDLIVSNTDKYVKIMFRDSMMFETNSSTPTLSAQNNISQVNTVLQKYPNTLVQVVGHTDSRGSHSYNQTLSDKRATNVGNILTNSGISNQIFAKGCSYDKPVAMNNSESNMALNRRVEIYLYPNQQSVIDVCK